MKGNNSCVMLIGEHMGVRKTGCLLVFVVLSCVLVTAASFGSRKEVDEVIIGDPRDLVSLEIDDGMDIFSKEYESLIVMISRTAAGLGFHKAEVLWNYCGRDILQLNEAIEILNIPRSPLLGKENLQKVMSIQHPIMKQTLLDCLIQNHLLVGVSGEDGQSKNWIIGYLESVFFKPDTRRRVLGRGLLQSSMETPSPSPSPGLGLSLSPAPAPTASQPPAMSPAPIFFGPEINSTFEPPSEVGFKTESPNSSAPLNKNSTNHRPVVIAVAVTASVTFVFAVLLFCYYTKVWKKGSRPNDNRSLPSLSMNDYGSSPNAFSVGNKYDSSLNVNYYPQSVIANSSVSQTQTVPLGTLGSPDKYSVEPPIDTSNNIIAGVPLAPLKPPPGKVNDFPPQLPSPKPPPSIVPPTPPQAPAPPPPRAPAPPPPPRAPGPPPPPLKPSGGVVPLAPGPPPLPAKPPGINSGSRPPPPPRPGVGPPRPPPTKLGGKARPPPGPKPPSNAASGSGGDVDNESEAAKAKLKPFFWDKVLANPDQSMVWHQIKSGSFQFDEDMIESLFGYAAVPEKNKNEPSKGSSSQERPAQFIQIIDAKKAQNLSILLRALNVTTEEVCDAIQEGNELSVELLQTLLKVAPTQEEELKLRLFNGELSQLGIAERFLKTLVDIPFAFKRLEALAFMGSLQEEVSNSKESFAILEVACKELRSSRIFLKLLEAVLKTGNRMNNGTFRGGAQAFKLDTLLKLSDVKGTDGKTTLLHFVVQEIIRSEGIRAAHTARESQSSMSSIKVDELLEDSSQDMEEQYRSLGLEVVSGLGNGLESVKRAANLDTDGISVTVTKLEHALVKTRDFLNAQIMSMDEQSGFRKTLESFVQNAEIDIMWLLEEEKRIMALVKSTGDYFHGNAGKEDGLRLFVIVRDFLIILDKTCKQVRDAPKKPKMIQKVEATPSVVASASSDPRPPSSPDIRQRLFPGITDRRADSSSSDDESS